VTLTGELSVPAIAEAIRDRGRGALLGLAVGDALGTTLEFKVRDRHPLHTEMTGGGPFGLAPGHWTDDTAMALALADSLTACRGFDGRDLMDRFVGWWRKGQYSSTRTCFDIGITTREALAKFERKGEVFAGSTNPRTAGNGSLMRLAPVAVFAVDNADAADQIARDQSRTTHGAPEAVDACAYLVQLLRSAISGEPDLLRPRSWHDEQTSDLCSLARTNDPNRLSFQLSIGKAVQAIALGSWRRKARDEIRSSGYVIDTLEAALWSVGTTSTFEDALILAVNLGQDADTVGAVTGQLAGAIYGAYAIPSRWLTHLAWRDEITRAADLLFDARAPCNPPQ
jgi:ADP-ribosyl-[dinitrogen reductase] hydrolase